MIKWASPVDADCAARWKRKGNAASAAAVGRRKTICLRLEPRKAVGWSGNVIFIWGFYFSCFIDCFYLLHKSNKASGISSRSSSATAKEYMLGKCKNSHFIAIPNPMCGSDTNQESGGRWYDGREDDYKLGLLALWQFRFGLMATSRIFRSVLTAANHAIDNNTPKMHTFRAPAGSEGDSQPNKQTRRRW